MIMYRHLTSFALAIAVSATAGTVLAEAANEVVLNNDVQFQPLNPARGDAAPKAGVLWGDIKKDVPTGALIVFADGFSSPPHIHNITYRGVVISGAVHNDDPNAENLWMGPDLSGRNLPVSRTSLLLLPEAKRLLSSRFWKDRISCNPRMKPLIMPDTFRTLL